MTERPGIASFLRAARGVFIREIAQDRVTEALAGSHAPGRYSRANQPTLYLSASRSGVEAAMRAHRERRPQGAMLRFEVDAKDVFDLRKPEALARVRAECGDPLGDWQLALSRGETPASWRTRDWLESVGAAGLIDPSRQAPGLWHLVLFRWNQPGEPQVSLVSDEARLGQSNG